jgi:hypothetical protein
MTRICLLNALAGVFFWLSIGTATAQAPPISPWVFKVDGGAAHQTEVDMKDNEGGFAVDRWFASGGVDYGWDRRTSLGISIGGGQSNYEFNSESDYGGGEPWSKINDYRVAMTGRFGIGETGTMLIIPTVRFNGESGASSSDSRTYGLFAAAFWRINEDLNIGPGIGVFSRLEDGTRIFPILAIDWNISERWNLATGRGLAASQGPGLTLSYTFSPHWKLGISGRYESLEFRLDDEGEAPGGVGRDQSFPLVVSAMLDPNPKVSLSLFMGLEFGGELRLKNALDEVIQETKYDPAPIFGVTFEGRF